MPSCRSLVKNSLLLSHAFVFLSASAHSQQTNPAFETLSVDQGMPTTVTCILQDRTGYLWFGTYNGLYKYDGYSFVSYRHDPEDTSSIADNKVLTVYEDKSGVLWTGGPFGLDRFDRTTGTFLHYAPGSPGTGEDLSTMVGAICEDRSGVFWVGTGWGLYQFNRSIGEFVALGSDTADPGSIHHDPVNAVYEDREGLLWFATGAGLYRYDCETAAFVHAWRDPGKRSMPGNTVAAETSQYWIHAVYQDETGILWLGTNGGLVGFDPNDRTVTRYRHNPESGHNRISSICQDVATGSLWLATGRALLSFNRQSKAFASYDFRTNAVCYERSGTLWVGTDTYVQKLNRAQQPFKKYSMNTIAQVIKSGKEGILWVKVPNGYMKFDIRREQFVPYSFAEGRVRFVYNSGGDVLLYSAKGILTTVDSSGTTHVWGPYSQAFMNTTSITWKGSTGYWIGSRFGGLFFVDFKTQQRREIKDVKLHISYIYEDAGGTVWVAAGTGKLFCYNQAADTLTEFISDPRYPSRTGGSEVNEIYEDTKGRLWFATNDGLFRLDRSTRRFVRYSERSGFPSNNVRGILEDDHGNLWVATNKGISKFDPETHRVRNYDASYGVEPTADVFYGKGCTTQNGEMYFGGASGFTRFHPDSVKDNQFVPPVVITSFRKFDKPYPLARDIRLPYDENFVAFEFAALSYVSPERNLYAYKMEGVDKDWVHSGTRRYASYPGLEPGEYVFRVKGSNNDGVWNEAGTSISIVITPPWWKTTWAYVLYVMAVLTTVYGTWRMQVKRLRIRHAYEMSRFETEKLHEMDRMKSRFFANISHEFRTPLMLILGPVTQAIEATEDLNVRRTLQVVHRNANRLLGLVHQLLDLSRLESGTMTLRTVLQDIVPLLKALALSFTSYAERKRISLTFTAGDAAIPAYVDRDKVEKIITNILSNAFKFTPEGGRIDVAVTKDRNRVTVAIRDTGIGIPAEKIPRIYDRFYQVDGSHTRAQEGTGIGLSLTKELVELHKGSIEVESAEGKGTTFVVHFPLGKEHLKPEEICTAEAAAVRSDLAGSQPPLATEEVIGHAEKKPDRPDIGAMTETGKPLLLIVEDNADVRRYIATNIEKEYRILEAEDGHDGWTKSVEHMPDVIISDVMMPGMDGFSLCDHIKRDERTSHIPVILLTAKASHQDKIDGFKTGADDYIMKPFEPAELKARIENLIEQRKRVHAHFRHHGLFEIDEGKITDVDRTFLQNAVAIITRHMSDASFGVEVLAAEMAVSRSVLLKKMEALVGEPPSELIKRTRLMKAATLIESNAGNISEVALEVGFNNPSYFAECFRKQFGVSPSHYHRRPADQ